MGHTAEAARPCDDLGQAGLFEQAMRHAPIGMALVTAEGRFLEVNAALCRMLGRDETTLRQLLLRDLTHPDDLAESLELVQEVVAGRREAFQLEKRYIHRDGHLIWGQVSVSCLQNEGECLFIVQIVDVSETVKQRQALAASEEHFRLLAENSSDVVFRLDSHGHILWVSPSLTTALGWLPEDWIGQVGTQFLLHAGEAQQYQANYRSLLTGGNSVIAREQIYAKDGSLHWAETHAGPYINTSGVVDGIVASFRLIDEMVAAEHDLRRSEQRHRLLADNIQDVVWSMDLDGKFTYLSPSVKRLRGFSPEEVMAMSLEENVMPTSLPVMRAGLAQAQADASAGRPISMEVILEETCKGGGSIWTEVKATGVYSARGEVVEMVGVTRDVTTQHRLRESLRTSEERYRLLAENARDVIWTMEADGRISYLSPSVEVLRGFSPEEAMAQSLEQIHPPESRQQSQAYFQQLLEDLQAGREPQPFRGELEYYCQDGSTIWAEVLALPTFDTEGAFHQLLGVSRDISERKRFEAQLMEANRKLQELATTDGLTGIWNRRHMEVSIQEAIDRSDRYGEPYTLILADIDFFKAINDRLGHALGDLVLIEFCRRIGSHLRSSDGFSRWGGEEFLILLSHADARSGSELAEKLRLLISDFSFPDVGTVTASFGVAQHREGESALDWFQRVDNRVYAAKSAGRNCVVGD